LQTEAFDLAGTSKSNMIQEIKKIPKWTWLKAFRPSTDDRRRCYRVKLKAGANIPEEVCGAITMTKPPNGPEAVVRLVQQCPLGLRDLAKTFPYTFSS
jgi:hypothetical protein